MTFIQVANIQEEKKPRLDAAAADTSSSDDDDNDPKLFDPPEHLRSGDMQLRRNLEWKANVRFFDMVAEPVVGPHMVL